MSDLACPKCENPMRSYERSGVTIDQCTGCRGIFLDRGELERIMDAEGTYYEERGFSAKPAGHWDQQPYSKHHDKKKRKESFLSDLLDF
jgi:uncharacterized protein